MAPHAARRPTRHSHRAETLARLVGSAPDAMANPPPPAPFPDTLGLIASLHAAGVVRARAPGARGRTERPLSTTRNGCPNRRCLAPAGSRLAKPQTVRYRSSMRFGSRSHDVDKLDAKVTTERDRLVRTLRDLADRIEKAPSGRITESVTRIAVVVEPLVRVVERALGRSL